MKAALIDLTAAVVGLAALGTGLWWKDPAWALVVLGGVVFGLTIYSRMGRAK